MPSVEEKAVSDALLKYKGTREFDIGNAHVAFSLNPADIHDVDSPDFIFWVEISMRVFGQDLKLRIPLPFEAEKGGIYGGALEDLRKFVEREHYPIELPMLVVAESGYENTEEKHSIPVRFSVTQVPVRVLDE